MSDRGFFSKYPGIALALIGIPTLFVPVAVLEALSDQPTWIAILVASATCIPTALSVYFPIYWIDSARRGNATRSDESGITGYGLLYAQALVFLYAPAVVSSSEDGEPLRHAGFLDWLICLAAAGAAAWGGYVLKKRGERRLALAKLAATRPHTATRFIVRVDKKGWSEIEPKNVLQYQAAFEKALASLGKTIPNSVFALTAEQEEALVRCAIDLRYSWRETTWPFVPLALVLIYIESPAAERERDRADWAAAVATDPDASRVRDWVTPIATAMFERQHPSKKALPASSSGASTAS